MNRLVLGFVALLGVAHLGCLNGTTLKGAPVVAPAVLPAGPAVAPCDGPSLPLPFLAQCNLSSASPGGSWCRGIYDGVNFFYTSVQPAAKLASEYEKATGIRPKQQNSGGWFYDRKVGTVSQQCAIRTNDDHKWLPGAASCVVVFESVDLMRGMPARWYRKAVAPSPPAPLEDVPFHKGIRADSVTVTSLASIESSVGVFLGGRDARVYRAHLKGNGEATLDEIRRWASANGYREVNPNDFFKSGSGCFEFEVGSTMVSGVRATGVTWYVSDKKADHPVARIKTQIW